MSNTLGDRIEIIKKENRFDIIPFANLLGVSPATYSNWVSTKTYPSADKLIILLNKFPEYNAEWLLLGTGEKYKSGQNQEIVNEPLTKYLKDNPVKEEVKEILRKIINKIDEV